jgi:hypothetical protein
MAFFKPFLCVASISFIELFTSATYLKDLAAIGTRAPYLAQNNGK